nr:PREDICTED: discoidin domain-containing receptor 2-like [Bemisia tabaci]
MLRGPDRGWVPLPALLVLLAATPAPYVTPLDIRNCSGPLGMESGAISDALVTASSSYVPNVGPKNGRLRLERAGGAWCPKQQVEKGVREYIQMDLSRLHFVTGIQTQGRFDHGRGQEYAEEYMFEYWRPGLKDWKQYSRWDGKQILMGNSDTATVVTHRLMPAVYASQVRVLPYSVHRRTVCLRVEILGCPAKDGMVSYQIPREPSWDTGQDLSDSTYDGEVNETTLSGGMGRLADGIFGGDNFKLDIGYGRGSGWVGWRKDSFPKNSFEMVVEFERVRNFSVVHFFTNNLFSKGVQVFSKARIQFSMDGQHYGGRTVTYNYMPDTVLENARNVTIHLHHHIARFIKIQFHFANQWIMLSEMDFESEVLSGNTTSESLLQLGEEEILINSGNMLDPPWDSLEPITASKEGDGTVEAVIGVLTAIVLLLVGVFVFVLVLSRRHKLQGSPTTILKNPFGVNINMKDLLINLSPLNNATTIHLNNLATSTSPDGQTDLEDDSPKPPSYTDKQDYALITNHLDHDHSFSVVEKEGPGSGSGYDTDATAPAPTPQRPARTYSKSKLVNEYAVPHQPLDAGSVKGSQADLSLVSGLVKPEYAPLRPQHFVSTDNNLQDLEESKDGVDNNRSKHSTHSLQNTLHAAPRIPIAPHPGSEPITRKRYHTSPREKHRMSVPSVSWNIAPAMGQVYKCRQGDLVPIPRYCLKVSHRLGHCHLGEVIICDTDEIDLNVDKVAVRTCRGDSVRELRFLSSLIDPHIVRILGVCTAEQPPWTVMEYPNEMGDLAQLLRTTDNLSCSIMTYMASQIASGMRYLESKNVVHKDLAARNCLVSRGYQVKVGDLAMCNTIYKTDYVEVGIRPPAPIRWLPWESVLLDKYTCPSSVWMFGVTLWELYSLARERPFTHFTNEQVIQNAEHMYYGSELQVFLAKPNSCPPEIYEVMCHCWSRDQEQRPTFKQLYKFLNHKVTDTFVNDEDYSDRNV